MPNDGALASFLTGEALSTSKHRRRFVNAWQDRQISDTALNGRLGIHGDTATVDLSGEWAQTTRGDSTSPSLGWGKGHLTWAPNLPGVAPRVDGRALYGGSHRGERFGQMDLGGELATQLWLGALAFRPYVGGGWIRQLASDATASSYVIGYESRIDWQRAHRSTHHRAGLILDGNWGQGYGQTEDIDPWMRTEAYHTHGISIDSQWSGPGRHLHVRFRQGVHGLSDGAFDVDPPGTEVTISFPNVQVHGLHYGSNYVWSEVRVRTHASGEISGSYVRIGRHSRQPPWTRWADRYRYVTYYPTAPTFDSLLVRGRVSAGPLQLYWAPGLDVQTGQFIGQAGGIKITGRCQCWAIELDIQHERATRFPNVMLEIDLRRP